MTVNGVAVGQIEVTANEYLSLFGLVPPGGTYSVSMTNTSIGTWTETR